MGKSNKKKKNFLLNALERDIRRVKVEVYHDTKYLKSHIPYVIMGFFTIVFFSIIFFLFKTKQGQKFTHSATSMVGAVENEKYLIKPNIAYGYLESNNPSWEFVDLRSPRFYNNKHIANARNNSFSHLLKKENNTFWKSDTHKILYAQDEARAVNAWFILSELGYKNIHVLEGGYDFWQNNISSKFTKVISINDEKAKYDFKKIMKENQGAGLQPAATSKLSDKPKPPVKRKKKKAAGGCG